jgi:glycosyltransferase involved in cell wall biosynthesis
MRSPRIITGKLASDERIGGTAGPGEGVLVCSKWRLSPEPSSASAGPRRPLRVLYFSNSLARGGAEEHLLILIKGLDRTRFRVHLVCSPELAETLRADVPSDVELIPLHLRGPAHVWPALRLAWLIAGRRIDILHSHLSFASTFASPIGWVCRVRVIVETPNLNDPRPRRLVALRALSDLIVGSCVDICIAVAQANARHLIARKRRPPGKIVVIHNAADLQRFEPDRQPPPDLRRSLGFPDAAPVLVVIARLQPQKGHRVLLRALAAVRRQFPLVRLVCVGDGPLRSELEREASELGLQEAVRFLGYRRDVPSWLALADVSVLPSFFEGLPLVAIESLAAGRAVVATAVDGTPEVIIDNVTGLTVPSGDAERLAEAIIRLLRDPVLRRRLGSAGRRFVLERFDKERLLAETQGLYLRTWEARARRRHDGGSLRRDESSVAYPGATQPPDPENVQAELSRARLERVGSGFEKIVFGSTSWVVKIPRGERGLAASLLATAVVGRTLRSLTAWTEGRQGTRLALGLRSRPGGARRLWNVLQGVFRAVLTMVPERWWRGSGVERRVRWLRARADECQRLAVRRLDGTPLVPQRVEFSPIQIRTARWGRRRTVTTAYQRVDRTLWEEACRCRRLGRFEEFDGWLDRFLSFQTELWRRGVFLGVSNPFENHGVLGDRLVLVDYSGLMEDPQAIRLTLDTVRARWLEEARGLSTMGRPGASREAFEQRLSGLMQSSAVRRYWPTPDDPRWNG